MSKSGRGFFNCGFPLIINLILGIIPIFSGLITRLMRGHIIAAILSIPLAPLFWILDIFGILTKNDIFFFA